VAKRKREWTGRCRERRGEEGRGRNTHVLTPREDTYLNFVPRFKPSPFNILIFIESLPLLYS